MPKRKDPWVTWATAALCGLTFAMFGALEDSPTPETDASVIATVAFIGGAFALVGLVTGRGYRGWNITFLVLSVIFFFAGIGSGIAE